MRKLKLQVQLSVDGFLSTGPNDDQRWVTWAFEEIEPYVLELNATADTMLIGRKLATDFIPYWEEVAVNPSAPMHALGQLIAGFEKILFSQTLEHTDFPRTRLVNGDFVEEVQQLKRQAGKDMLVVGGSSFVASLVKEGLIDEFHLFVNPVALGKGASAFELLGNFQRLKLKRAIPYTSGIVLLHYDLDAETPF